MVRVSRFQFTITVAAVCLFTAVMAQGQTPTPRPGDCCSPNPGPGCNDPVCEACICDLPNQAVCCQVEWDAFCVADTTRAACASACRCDQTPGPTPTPGGNCCSVHGGPGCDVAACQACVCGIDAPCCQSGWDATCVSEARAECAESCPCEPLPTETPAPTPTPGGDCCTAHAGPSCDDSPCRACVCGLDPECCESVWDSTCASEASQECALECPCESVGDCCAPHGGVGCDDATCKNCVCDLDAACCTEGEGWDTQCVDEATVECAASCTCEVAGSCCEEHIDTLGCDDRRCQECVCAFDTECCTVGWDARCADEAANECQLRCAGCESSDCCDVRDQGGCPNDPCEACVCGIDPFCCDEVWDGSCADYAADNCNSVCQCSPVSACAGDCNNDQQVAVNELVLAVNIALGNAPASQCPSVDRNGDGTVTVSELIQAVNAALNGC